MRIARLGQHKRGTGPRFFGRLLLAALAFVVWLVLPVPALSAQLPPLARPAAMANLPWLSVSGDRIVDETGRTVTLRGFNDDALLERTMRPAPLDAADASIMQASGFDVVRLPIAWSLLEPRKGHFDTAYLDRIARAVALLNAHALYVVLDMHFLGWSPAYGGSGAPSWATVAGVPDPVWGPMPSLGRFLSPAINISTATFWFDRDWQDEFLQSWRRVAARFRESSGVAGYDIINEPHSFPLPPLRFDKDQLFPFYARAVSVIGAVDPNHLFFLDNDMTGDLPTAVVPLHARNLVYAAHVYTGSLIPPRFTGSPVPLATHVGELAREAQQVPAPLWIGEFSINAQQDKAAEWIRDMLDDLDAQDAGWAWWQWRESSGWGIRSADGTRLDMAMLRLLARPYLAAAPRDVEGAAASGGAALTVHVPRSAAPRSVAVAWPAYTLGPPAVSGACVESNSWAAGAARLTMTFAPGSGCTVELTRAPGA